MDRNSEDAGPGRTAAGTHRIFAPLFRFADNVAEPRQRCPSGPENRTAVNRNLRRCIEMTAGPAFGSHQGRTEVRAQLADTHLRTGHFFDGEHHMEKLSDILDSILRVAAFDLGRSEAEGFGRSTSYARRPDEVIPAHELRHALDRENWNVQFVNRARDARLNCPESLLTELDHCVRPLLEDYVDPETDRVGHAFPISGSGGSESIHAQYDGPDSADRAVLTALQSATSMVAHHLAHHQPHSARPHPALATEAEYAVAQTMQYLGSCAPSEAKGAKTPIETAVDLCCQIAHAESVADVHTQEIVNPTDEPEHAIRRLHALNLALARVENAHQALLDMDPAERRQAEEIVGIHTHTTRQLVHTTLRLDHSLVRSELPEDVSPTAALHPELVNAARHNQSSLLEAGYGWTTDERGRPTTPAVVRRYHQGVVHYRATNEPLPRGYPSGWANEDYIALMAQSMQQTQTSPATDLSLQVQASSHRARFALHDIQHESWRHLQDLAYQLGLPPTAANFMLKELSGNLPDALSEDPPPFYTKPATDESTARAILDAAQDAGADDRQLYRLATAMGYRTLVPAPHPVPTRHVQAINRAARQRGLHQRNVALMEQALDAPETVADLISRA